MTVPQEELTSGHSPAGPELQERFDLYACSGLSIAVLRHSEDNRMLAFTHRHEAYEFIIPITPIPGLINERALYFGEPGKVYPVASGRSHGLSFELRGVSHIDIIAERKAFEEALSTLGFTCQSLFNFEFHTSQRLMDLIQLFKDEAGGQRHCAPVMNELASLIRMELILLGADPGMDLRHERQYYNHDVRDMADYILMHCTEDLTLDGLSARCGMSKYHFVRTFTRVMGETPYAYILRARIAKAKMLLEYGRLPVTEVSSQCGFSTANYFSVLFKKKTGQAPSEYRRLHQRRTVLQA